MKITSELIIRAKDTRGRDTVPQRQVDNFIEKIKTIVDSIHFVHEQVHPNSKIRRELIRHFPVALVASIQGSITSILSELLNNNPELLRNIKNRAGWGWGSDQAKHLIYF